MHRRDISLLVRRPLSAILLAAAAATLVASPALADVVLDCNFDHLPLGEIVPTGGAERGEPTNIGLTNAIVAMPPTMSPAVKITDNWPDMEGLILFEFLNGVEVTTGEVTIETTFCFLGFPDDYIFSIREQGGRSTNFGDLIFTDEGRIYYGDSDTPESFLWYYDTSRAVYIRMVFDLDLGSYSVYVDDIPVLSEEPHGVTAERGIGAIYVGVRNDFDQAGIVCIDDVRVETSAGVATESQTWTAVKNLFD